MQGVEYPFSLIELGPGIRVEVESEEDVPRAFSRFTEDVFAAMGEPGKELHPRVFRRAIVDGRRVSLCPHSFPTPRWARLVIEQIHFDTSGMQPRLLYNDQPWVNQPAIYCECFMVVQRARTVADEWIKKQKEREENR